ncbi:MAG: RNA polymerase-associated protein RapA, partial [Immundisolibacteraceae bacterium]|nr:RNA polymerase-associated protein RapA [Immundisolibacteraceae bacterium]
MNSFVVGQCWSSEAEPELGLGNLLLVEGRRITVHFHSADATRVYAMDSAPLRRVTCKPGEAVVSKDGLGLVISRLQERNGVIFYSCHSDSGQEIILPETELQTVPERNPVEEALKFGDFDRLSRFQLRAETLHRRQVALSSPLRGLGCNRTALLPHQLYLADEVGSRHAPRVLLADEVGLGKTIEAGMVLQRQLQAGRVKRVLILLSENLQHQWLVEMLRRFNLRFALFDQDRFEDSDWPNPMLSEQLVITSLELLQNEPEYALHACDGEWDLLVVDEAHRLGGMEPEPSPAFSLVAALSGLIPAVLLLTATPEQLGQHAHFDRLRLLDPDRFHDYQLFQQETRAFQQIAQLFDRLSEPSWSESLTSELHQFDLLNEDEVESLAENPKAPDRFREVVRNRLLDRHGTGRLLFRNTRAAVGGFPERRVNRIELALPDHYSASELSPERLVSDTEWWRNDPRVDWLIDFVEGDHQGKVLLICSEDASARQLHDYLRLRTQVRSALFHGEMTVLQRDRAAAWFAETDGAQLMICSEIGSEGR